MKCKNSGRKTYSFYRDFPELRKKLASTTIDELDDLIEFLEERSSMISFQDCLDRFGAPKSNEIFNYMKYLAQKGVFDAYNFERVQIEA